MPFRKISIELVMDEGNADAWMQTMRDAIGEMDKHASLKRLEILDEVSEGKSFEQLMIPVEQRSPAVRRCLRLTVIH